jgi:hypothetical protein
VVDAQPEPVGRHRDLAPAHLDHAAVQAEVRDADAVVGMTDVLRASGEANGEPMSATGMGTFGDFKDPSGTTVALIGP